MRLKTKVRKLRKAIPRPVVDSIELQYWDWQQEIWDNPEDDAWNDE